MISAFIRKKLKKAPPTEGKVRQLVGALKLSKKLEVHEISTNLQETLWEGKGGIVLGGEKRFHSAGGGNFSTVSRQRAKGGEGRFQVERQEHRVAKGPVLIREGGARSEGEERGGYFSQFAKGEENPRKRFFSAGRGRDTIASVIRVDKPGSNGLENRSPSAGRRKKKR